MSEFKTPLTATVSMEIGKNSNGNIATQGETIAGVKRTSMDGIKADATLAQANTVYNTFFGTICNSVIDSLSAKKTTVQEVI